jgi:hypothetical protein
MATPSLYLSFDLVLKLEPSIENKRIRYVAKSRIGRERQTIKLFDISALGPVRWEIVIRLSSQGLILTELTKIVRGKAAEMLVPVPDGKTVDSPRKGKEI